MVPTIIRKGMALYAEVKNDKLEIVSYADQRYALECADRLNGTAVNFTYINGSYIVPTSNKAEAPCWCVYKIDNKFYIGLPPKKTK